MVERVQGGVRLWSLVFSGVVSFVCTAIGLPVVTSCVGESAAGLLSFSFPLSGLFILLSLVCRVR